MLALIELWQLAAVIASLGAGLAFLAAAWWLGYRSHVGQALELYVRTGGFWHRGTHYDVRQTEPTYGLGRGGLAK